MIELQDLTSGTVAGNGVFDELMKATKEHIKDEYQAGRIKGTEYATVYLGGLQACMQTALQFVMAQDKINKELELLDKEILLKEQALLNAQAEHTVLVNQALKLVADTALTDAQTLNVPKQGALIEAQTAVALKEVDLADEKIDLVKEEVLVAKEKVLVSKEEVLIAKAKLVNIPKEGAVLDAQECKLRAEYDTLVKQVERIAAESALLAQKKLTEEAQINGAVIDATSVIGKQIALYNAQTSGYARDAEQRAAKIVADLMGVQMSVTDYQASTTNRITDEYLGKVMYKLYEGIGALAVTTP